MSMKVRMVDTGRVVVIENDEYAIRLVEQQKAVFADDAAPVTPGGEAVDIFQLNRDVKGMRRLTTTLARAWMQTDEDRLAILQSGAAGYVFRVGDLIPMPWTLYKTAAGTEGTITWRVVHIGDAVDENGEIHHNALYLMSAYGISVNSTMIFDAKEETLASTPTFEDGTYYYTRSGVNYTQVDVVYGDPIPEGAEYYISFQPNMEKAMEDGYGRWSHGWIRQWLNSEAAFNMQGSGWWSSQHIGDAGPGDTAAERRYGGFLAGVPETWKALMRPVRMVTALNMISDGGGVEYTYDRVFLPSASQVGGTATDHSGWNIDSEGTVWDWFRGDENEDESYTYDNFENERRIIKQSEEAENGVSWMTRSPYLTNPGEYMDVGSGGIISSEPARMPSKRITPCCVIW